MELIKGDNSNHKIAGDLNSVSSNNRGYLIDMDGVIYRGSKLIPGSDLFIQILLEKGIPFLFLTNNSQRSRCDVVLKLAHMGIDVEIKHIFTCAISTARFLASQKPNGSAYVIGEAGRLLNFEVLEKALKLIIKGSKLLAINLVPTAQLTVEFD